MAKNKRFKILSPDGFDISFEKREYDEKEVETAIKAFADKYQQQGYYSSMNGKIHLSDLPDYCQVIPI